MYIEALIAYGIYHFCKSYHSEIGKVIEDVTYTVQKFLDDHPEATRKVKSALITGGKAAAKKTLKTLFEAYTGVSLPTSEIEIDKIDLDNV